jgi:hypothetical protein
VTAVTEVTAPAQAEGAAVAVAGVGLDGTTYGPPTEPLSPSRWRELQRVVAVERLWFLLADAVATRWPATDEQIDEVVHAEERAATQVLALDRRLIELAGLLDERSVPYRVLKGPAHAERLWRRGDLRFHGDIDLVVAGTAFDDAVQLVERQLSGRRHRPDPRAGFTAQVGKGTTLTLPDGVEVDLHRTLADGPFGASIFTDDLFARGDEVRVGPSRIPTLSRPEMFIHACLHVLASAGRRTLIPLRDVAEGLARLDGREAAEVIERSERWRCDAVVARSIGAARATFRLDGADPNDLARWAVMHRARPRERAWLLTTTGSFPGRPALATVAMVPALRTWRDRAVFVRGVVAGDQRAPVSRRFGRLLRR